VYIQASNEKYFDVVFFKKFSYFGLNPFMSLQLFSTARFHLFVIGISSCLCIVKKTTRIALLSFAKKTTSILSTSLLIFHYRKNLRFFVISHYTVVVPHSKSGLVPRSSLPGAGQLGFWEIGKGGTIG
jgi:hypothetical protein